MLRHLHMIVLVFAFIALTQAIDLPVDFLRPRQNAPIVSGGSSSGPGTVATTTVAPPTTTPQTTATTVPTSSASPSQPPSSSASPDTPSSQPPTTTVQPPSSSATPSSQQTTPQTTQTSAPPSSSASSDTVISNTITSIPSVTDSAGQTEVTTTSTNLQPVPEVLTTITFTSDGRLVSTTATGTRTAVPTSTSKPGLASDYGSQNNTLSEGSKKLIGGIIGGIVGALLLGGIAFIVFKMWGRKKHHKVPSEEDYFGNNSGSTDSIALQKESRSGWGPSSLTSKFSEPLDRYKSPSSTPGSLGGMRSPNAASNF